LGASRISGGPPGFFRNAARISSRQRNVLPLPAGPRRNRACTIDFSPKDPAAESNLFVFYGKFWLVAGPNFCFFRRKAGYYFQRLVKRNLVAQTM
jgi:hypothetical protein